jgi:hypothetical protein
MSGMPGSLGSVAGHHTVVRWPVSLRALHSGALLLLAGCADTTAPVPGSHAALIQPSFSSVPLFRVVGEARAGQPFDVAINTFGLNSCWAKVRTDVEPGALLIITPYNREQQRPATGCFSSLQRIEHVVTLSYRTAGEKPLLIRGRAFDTRQPTQFAVTLIVKP